MFKITGYTDSFARLLEEWHNKAEFIAAKTSGSTGKPKKIHLLKSDMRKSAEATNRFFGINSSSILYCPLSADYIAGKMMLVRAIEADCTLTIEEPSNRILTHVEIPDINLIAIVPSQSVSLLEAIEKKGMKISNIIIGGAPMNNKIEMKFVDIANKHGISIYVTYGMTETCSHVALRKAGEPYYTSLPGISFDIDSDSRLIIKSSERSFSSLNTNDIVELLSPSSFIWRGRADNVINSGGIKIYPEAVETLLSGLIDVPFFVSKEADEKLGERMILCINGSYDSDLQALMENMHDILPNYSVPKKIYRLPYIPLTETGKIARADAEEAMRGQLKKTR